MDVTPTTARFERSYVDGTPPWVIDEPQPAVVALERAGDFRGRVLDIGCGTGEHTIHLAGLGYDVLGADAAPTALAMARSAAAERGIPARFTEVDALDPAGLGRFDTVLDSALFHIFDAGDQVRYAEALREVCVPGAHLHLLALSTRGPGFGPEVDEAEIRAAFDRPGWEVSDVATSTYRGVVGEHQSGPLGLPGRRPGRPPGVAGPHPPRVTAAAHTSAGRRCGARRVGDHRPVPDATTPEAPPGPVAVLLSLPRPPARPEIAAEPGRWPGVEDPDALRTLVAQWLAGYGSAQTRRTYAYALGLPAGWAEAVTGRPARSADDGGSPRPTATSGGGPVPRTPPPAPRGPLHHLAWFRWCATRSLDPRRVTATHVTGWLHALDAAGAQKRTRARMLSTVAAFYGHLVEQGVLDANPAALNRRRMGLAGGSRDPSPTVRLTAGQVRALLDSAARLPHRTRHRELYARRAVTVVALLALGLRVSEVAGLDRDDLVVSGGERLLRVLGKGGVRREVYLTGLAADAVTTYLAERDRVTGAAAPARRDRAGAPASPLVTTLGGGRCSRFALYTRLRRVAEHAGPELDDVADRVHPHTLRHAYVTIALENGARIQHVAADVGHASIATTQHYDRSRRTRETSAADLVAGAITGADGPDP